MELGIGLELGLQGSRGVDCDGVGDGGGTWGQGELAQGQRADFGGTERSGRGSGFFLKASDGCREKRVSVRDERERRVEGDGLEAGRHPPALDQVFSRRLTIQE